MALGDPVRFVRLLGWRLPQRQQCVGEKKVKSLNWDRSCCFARGCHDSAIESYVALLSAVGITHRERGSSIARHVVKRRKKSRASSLQTPRHISSPASSAATFTTHTPWLRSLWIGRLKSHAFGQIDNMTKSDPFSAEFTQQSAPPTGVLYNPLENAAAMKPLSMPLPSPLSSEILLGYSHD